MKKRIAILGSTGSIGTQALEVLKSNPDKFELEILTANENADLLISQAIEFKPNSVVISNDKYYQKIFDALDKYDIKVFAGEESVSQIVEMPSVDMVLVALVGFAGVKPTIKAIEAKKQIALANKEALVVAGELIMKLAHKNDVNIIPVDSEHSAIFQCLVGEGFNNIEKIILTASGGPFRGKNKDFLAGVTKIEALKHPNWKMGNKVTIDSASLMNKGLEAIEAKWLFDLKPEKIEIIIHPQSIIHSMVEFEDGSMKAQLGIPDMKVPIQYALSFPYRLKNNYSRFSFLNYPELTFESVDMKNFRNLALAFEAMKIGGNMPCILNAANEIVVSAFLDEKIKFLEMTNIIEKCMKTISFSNSLSYKEFFESDMETRKIASELIG
ncbi:MAG: 1-deoxy-D-xylulose-5-phosphate reductoisomerase [Bacteroidales bacterium]|nr:1-deoxy-D-xylulose-5-phosphate reductoisomerase [Bacteroidales bacterium]